MFPVIVGVAARSGSEGQSLNHVAAKECARIDSFLLREQRRQHRVLVGRCRRVRRPSMPHAPLPRVLSGQASTRRERLGPPSALHGKGCAARIQNFAELFRQHVRRIGLLQKRGL
jgi:hypothetical protein